jgi:hypothetical protein
MPETELILLLLAVCLLLLIVGQMARIHSRLKRLEGRMPKLPSTRERSSAEAAVGDTGSGGIFESFLQEDPSRRALTKSEQFAAFRKWRKDKGLNWSKP